MLTLNNRHPIKLCMRWLEKIVHPIWFEHFHFLSYILKVRWNISKHIIFKNRLFSRRDSHQAIFALHKKYEPFMLSRIYLGKQLGSTRAQFFFGRKNLFEDECEICEPDVPYISGHNPLCYYCYSCQELVVPG